MKNLIVLLVFGSWLFRPSYFSESPPVQPRAIAPIQGTYMQRAWRYSGGWPYQNNFTRYYETWTQRNDLGQ